MNSAKGKSFIFIPSAPTMFINNSATRLENMLKYKNMNTFLKSILIGAISLTLGWFVITFAPKLFLGSLIIPLAIVAIGFLFLRHFRKDRFFYLYLIWRNILALYVITALFIFVGYAAGQKLGDCLQDRVNYCGNTDILVNIFYYALLPLLSILIPYLVLRRKQL